MIIRLVALGLIAIFMTGCASVNRGATDYFRIDTVPQGTTATTTIETRDSKLRREKNPKIEPIYESCTPTPCAIALPRRSEFIVKLEHPGFQSTELFITNSGSTASYSANAAATVATTTGTVAVTAPVAAALATTASQVTAATLSGLTAATVNVGTLGLVSFETALATTNTVFVATPTTTGSVVSSSIPPALAVTGVMLLTDMATGANLNLYPNPVVLGLAPEGVPAKIDPNVEGFKALLSAQSNVEDYCNRSNRDTYEANRIKCTKARKTLRAIKKDRRERHAAAKKAAIEAKRVEKERLRKEKASGKTEGS